MIVFALNIDLAEVFLYSLAGKEAAGKQE